MAKPAYNCTTCNHFNKLPGSSGGQCRRDPPTTVMIVVGAEIDRLTGAQKPLIHTQSLVPGVGPSDYCGSHPLAPKAIPIIGERNRFMGPTEPVGGPRPDGPVERVRAPEPANEHEPTLEDGPSALDKPQGEA